MSVATEHLPIFVTSDERDLLNRISRFEEAACTFVTEVVKMQVFDFELATLASECCAYRLPIIRENSNTSPELLQVFAMQLDQISNRFCIPRPLCHGWLAAINTALNLERP